MAADLMCKERTMGLTEAERDAEFDEHDIDVEAVLARTAKSFSTRRHAPLYEAPEFIKRLNAFEEVQAGDTVVFSCQWKGFPRPTVKWYKDDVSIPDDDRFTMEMDPGSMGVVSLLIKESCKSDEGAYKCKAENLEGVASTTGYLSVTGGKKNAEKTLASQKKDQMKQQQQQQEQQQNSQDEQNGDDDQQQLRKVQSDRMVSYPPHLRTIVEQKSVEEREAEIASNQPPSPLQDFIEKMQDAKAIGRGATWPFAAMGYAGSKDKDDDAQSHSSDTSLESQDFDRVSFSVKDIADDDDVFTEHHQVNGVHLPAEHKTPQTNLTSEDTHANGSIQKIHCGSRVRPLVGCVVSSTVTPPEIHVTSPKNSISDNDMPPKRKHGKRRTREENIRLGFPDFNLSLLYRLLDSPWGYFLPITSGLTFIAAATEMSPIIFVLFMTIISFICFRFLFPDHMKT